jgi:hypothetical protein
VRPLVRQGMLTAGGVHPATHLLGDGGGGLVPFVGRGGGGGPRLARGELGHVAVVVAQPVHPPPPPPRARPASASCAHTNAHVARQTHILEKNTLLSGPPALGISVPWSSVVTSVHTAASSASILARYVWMSATCLALPLASCRRHHHHIG